MMATNENEEEIIPMKAQQLYYHEDYWKDRFIEQRQNERVERRKATENWWLEEGVHGFETVTYLAHVIMLKKLCMQVQEIPELMDHQIFTFLKTCNFNIEKAFKLIIKHYELRNHIVETFEFRNPYLNKIRKVWRYVKLAPLPTLSIRNTRLIFIGLWNYNPSVFEFFPVLRLFNMAIEALTMCHNMHTSYEFIIDGEGFSLNHIPPYMRNYFFHFVKYLLYGFPLSVKAVHIVHASKDLLSLIRTLSLMISKKILSKIYYHSYYIDNLKTLFRMIGKRNLPSDIEGCGKCVYVYQSRFQYHVESLWGWFQKEEADWFRLIYHIKSESSISIKQKQPDTTKFDYAKAKLHCKQNFRKKLENIYNELIKRIVPAEELEENPEDFDSFRNEKDGYRGQIDWLDTVCLVRNHYNKRQLTEKDEHEEKQSFKSKSIQTI